MRANPAARLAQHYVDNFRALPWRIPPGDSTPPDPYRVWLSEVMLQQTTVATVRPRFERFVARWPTVEALAAASDEEILGEWAGLGYYARARNLFACARTVADAGAFPQSAADLRLLPGIGAYTAAAIAAIVFGEIVPAVDTNIRRVLSRFYGLKDPSIREVETLFFDWLGHGQAGDMVQAMMDLGATICAPREPRCSDCPLNGDCKAAGSGDPEAFPIRIGKKARPQRFGIAWWIERDGAVWLVRRPPKGLLGGMPALPGPDWDDDRSGESASLASVRHIFTHFALDLAIVAAAEPPEGGWWQPLSAINAAGLPTLYRKAVAAVIGARAKGPCGQGSERLEVVPSEP